MSESKPEQHPLLFDDLSDDEHRISESPTYQRRIFSTGSGRAKYHVRGAATILKQWPDHMSSLLTYWWMGLAMIGFTVLIIYNSVLAIAVIPSPSKINKMPPKLRADDYSFDYTSHKTVYLHVVIDDKKLDLNTYLPYIEIVSKDHPGLKYNFDLLVNDTADLFDPKNDSQSNSLWKDKATQLNILKHTLPPDTKINIRHKSLTRYMNESPLRKVWRHLPHHLFGFLIRCISVWNKGGISIDPLLLTPKSPHPHYLEKVSNIFKDFEDTTKRRTKLKKSYKNTKKAKKVNNIRDIIEALENENSSIDEHQKTDNLEEAENKLFITVNKNNTQFTDKKYTFENESNVVERTNKKHKPNNEVNSYEKHEVKDQKTFPMFLKLLYSSSGKNTTLKENIDTHNKSYGNSDKIILETKSSSTPSDPSRVTSYAEKFPSMDTYNTISSEYDRDLDLNIDLKGNIVATKTACHAFLGTVFNNVIHHIRDETVTDFIITELSIFCKGTWATCKGVDVILL